MTTKKIRLAVLLSGGGTTFQYIQDRIGENRLDAETAVVIGTKPDAYGLKRAENHGIPNYVVNRAALAAAGENPEEAVAREILALLDRHPADLVLLAGFMTRVAPSLIQRFPNRIMNTHPALIPSFCGKDFYGDRVHAAVLESGVKLTGCTLHFVDEAYDHGPIILQEAVPVLDDDTVKSLGDRVRAVEKPLYCKAIQLFAEGRLRVEGGRVFTL